MLIITNLLFISHILSSQMKKEVKYYLEDISRLSKISQSELDGWIAEMPFHQPLQLLASIKSEMDGHQTDENRKVHAAYFAEDYESPQMSNAKKSKRKGKKSISNAPALGLLPDTSTNVEEAISTIVQKDTPDAQIESDAIDVEKGASKLKTNRIVSSDLADELLEEDLIHEVLEDNLVLNATGNVSDDNIILTEEIDHEINDKKTEYEDESDLEVEIDTDEESSHEEENRLTSGVDYSNFKFIDSKIDSSIKNEQEDAIVGTSIKLDLAKADDISDKDLKDKIVKSKKDKSSKKKDKKKEKKLNGKEKKVKEKIKEKKQKKEQTEEKKNKQISGSSIKPLKKKKRKSDKKVKYILVDTSKEKNFGLKDYDGVSKYTSWLLEQESINDVDKNPNKALNAVKKSKKKNK